MLGILRFACITFLLAFLGATAFVTLGQQFPADRPPAPAQWVPFVAQATAEQLVPGPGSTYKIRSAGIYARNSTGSTYRRVVASDHSPLPLIGATNVAYLFDRPSHFTYIIDFTRRSVTREIVDASKNTEYGPTPLLRTAFDQHHAADVFLGVHVISGVECEGYRILNPRKKGKYLGEAWYAPSLNFLIVKSEGQAPDGGQVTKLLDDIHPSEEPDPKYFRLPEGFKIVN